MNILEDLDDTTKSLKDVIVADDWLTTSEVAAIFAVHPKTISRNTEKFKHIKKFKTLGGHLRFYKPDIMAMREKYEDNIDPS